MLVVWEAGLVELSRRENGEMKREQVKVESQRMNEGLISPDCPVMHIWGCFSGQGMCF